MLCIAKNVEVRASDITNNYDVLALLPGIELASIIDAYERLTTQQQYIAEYLVGSFNNIYLTARGFKYNIPYDQSNLQAQFSALGSKVFDFITTRIGWKSRVNETFRQYLSGVIIYASQQTKTFASWFQDQVNGTDRQIFIPYSENAFDAWSTFYNDPSGDGIASFGDVVTDWNSGQFYDFAFTSYAWGYSQQSGYNEFILNNSPVLFTNVFRLDNMDAQFCLSFGNMEYPDALFVQRSLTNTYTAFRYGFSDIRVLSNNSTLPNCYTYIASWDSKIYFTQNTSAPTWRTSIYQHSGTFEEVLNYAFNLTPIRIFYYNAEQNARGFYPFLTHVFLVDDLNTLSNPEEVYNVDSLYIDNNGEPKDYIIAPNGRMILPNFPGVPDDPMGFWDLIVDNSLDENGEHVDDNDYHTSIVNNNVINNYYVSDDVKINVTVDWFENPYTDQLNTDAQDFIGFAKDCVDCLGDFDIYMYGAIVVGLAGGIVKKLNL